MKTGRYYIVTISLYVLNVAFAAPFLLAQEAQDSLDQPADSEKEAVEEPAEKNSLLSADFNNEPTFIKAESLKLKSNERVFEYSGNVEVLHGDMTMTSNTLEGNYDENNDIQQLVARGNVIIVKGPEIRANGERAIYEKETETITLTDNPELQQKDSVLTADTIRIFLNEDRSVAEGHVRVKMVEDKTGKKGGATNSRSLLK